MSEDDKTKPGGVKFYGPVLHGMSATTSIGTLTVLDVRLWERTAVLPRPPEESPIYQAVGRVASEWSHVEHTLDRIIWELAGIDGAKGACITAQMMGVPNRCKTIIAQLTLFQRETGIATESLVAKVKDVSNKSNGPGDQRNRIVHDPWVQYSDQTGQFKAMPHKDYRFGIHPVDREALEKALCDIRAFQERTTKLREDVSALLEASRKTPPAS